MGVARYLRSCKNVFRYDNLPPANLRNETMDLQREIDALKHMINIMAEKDAYRGNKTLKARQDMRLEVMRLEKACKAELSRIVYFLRWSRTRKAFFNDILLLDLGGYH